MKMWQAFLAPLSLLWYTVAVIRGKLFDWGWLPSRSFDMPVICVGNLAVGGTGKTPHVEYLLRLLHDNGWRVAMLSRGYGRRTHGFILANVAHTAADIGDEPYQVLHNCAFATVAVCERRVEGIEQLLQMPHPPQVIVLDDAYQHRYVKAGLNILLTDAHRLFTHDYLLPSGRLREPASAARRAHIVIVTKCLADERPTLPLCNGQMLFYSHIAYGQPYKAVSQSERERDETPDIASSSPLEANTLIGRSVLLITAIANPTPLHDYILHQGASEVRMASFADHHTFTANDALHINKEWQKLPKNALAITTQKDATRLTTILPLLTPSLRKKLLVQPITVAIEQADKDHKTFNQTILHYVCQYSTNSRMD